MELAKCWAAALDDYVIDLSWAPDGSALAAASAAGPITQWAASDGKPLQHWDGHPAGANCVDYGSGVIASGGLDGMVNLYSATGGGGAAPTATVKIGPGGVDQLAWRPLPPDAAGAPLLAAAAGKKLCFLAADGKLAKAVADAPKTVSAVAWHPSGGALAAAAFGAVRIWDADDFLLQKEIPYANGVQALVWSPDGKWLVSGNNDPSVHLWTPETDLELHMSGYETKVKHLSFDQHSRWLATSGGRDACIWDCTGGGPEGRAPTMLPHDAPVCAVAFQRSHGLLATAATDGTVGLWSPERQQPLRATIKLPSPPTKLAWSADDRLLAIGTEAGTIYVLRCG